MSDPYRKLTAAVVEIGTQLRRIADAHTTDVAANPAATFAAVDVQAALNDQRRADRAELAVEDYRGSLSHALGLGTSAPWDAIHARAAELHRDNGQLLGEQAACIEAERRRDELAATLHDVLSHFTQKGHPGEPCLQTGWIAEKTVARWRAVLNPPTAEEQPPEDIAQCWRKEPHVPHTWTLSPEEGGVDCPGVDRPATKEQPYDTCRCTGNEAGLDLCARCPGRQQPDAR